MADNTEQAYELFSSGKIDDAELICYRLLAKQPDNIELLLLLGDIHHKKGALKAALYYLDQAVQQAPNVAIIHNNRGAVLRALGEQEQAQQSFRQAIALLPDYLLPHYNLGLLLMDLGDFSGAIAQFGAVMGLQADHLLAHLQTGLCFAEQNQHDLAREWFAKGLALSPNNIAFLNSLCRSWIDSGKYGVALGYAKQSLTQLPEQPEVFLNLASIYGWCGRAVEAIDFFRRAIPAIDDAALRCMAQDNVLMVMHYSPHYSPEEIAREHMAWGRQFAGSAPVRRAHDVVGTERRLRIGYVSSDFRMHPVAFFLMSIFSCHDPGGFERFCYSGVVKTDFVTRQLMDKGGTWRTIAGLPDDKVAELIAADHIDILVDLGGHTGGNRLPVFALKPAPIQVTWLGYPDTTGLAAIDYRITDAVADPPGMTEHLHSEELVRIPDVFLCYPPPNDCPECAPFSPDSVETPIFSSFNNFAKVSPEILQTWAAILKRVPQARLMIKASGLDDEWLHGMTLEAFARHGVDESRLILIAKTPSIKKHLELLSATTIHLDTYPYNGTTTTCEALWMGVPVVTWAGRHHVARVGATLLSAVGVPELIAHSEEGYIDMAVRLARDEDKLLWYSQNLRNLVASSPLTDAVGFTKKLEQAYREMWQRYTLV